MSSERSDSSGRSRRAVDAWAESLLPTGTFKGRGSAQALRQARCLVLFFHILIICIIGYMLGMLWNGRVEAYRVYYKEKSIEVPSLAVCPFKSSMPLVAQNQTLSATFTLFNETSHKGQNAGSKIKMKKCTDESDEESTNERGADMEGCLCADMTAEHLEFNDHYLRGQSEADRMTIRLSVDDTSKFHTLKLGFYDSEDETPDPWFYIKEGSYVLGSLQLKTWRLTDINMKIVMNAIRQILSFNWNGVLKKRHYYEYASHEIESHQPSTGEEGSKETRISYEMSTFLVEETYCSASSYSLYAIVVLVIIFITFWPAKAALVELLFPKWEPAPRGPDHRVLSACARGLARVCCCLCCLPAGEDQDEDAEEQKPLVV